MRQDKKVSALRIAAGMLVLLLLPPGLPSAGPDPARIAAIGAQELQHAVTVVNIEVPVRVFRRDVFVDGLGLGDFEVYEDGKLQSIEAVYRIRKTDIEKKEEAGRAYTPDVSRRFVLVFELHEYLVKVGEALDEFFDRVIAPGDQLHVVTPAKTYNFKVEAFTRMPKRKMADQLKGILKKDLSLGNSDYRSMMKGLEEIFALEIEPDIKQSMYMEVARVLRDLKSMDEQRLQAFADSSISVHFLFVTDKPGMHDNLSVGRMTPLRVELKDQSDSIYRAFQDVARATGGISDSSANPVAAFRKAAAASENYYLIYYSPSDYRPDGKFRQIEVRVKGRNYRVAHRAGYYAN